MFFDKKHRFRYKRIHGLLPLQINYTLVALAMQMVGTFGVVFVFLLGQTFMQSVSLLVGFYGLQRLMVMVFSPVVGWSIHRFGYRWTILLGMILASGKFVMFSQITSNTLWWLLVAAVIGGWQISSYEISFNGIFLEDNDDGKVGEQSGLLELMGNLGGLVAPLVAGFVVEWFGFEEMFLVAVALLLLATLPLFAAAHHKNFHKRFSFGESWLTWQTESELFKPVFWRHFQDAFNMFFWPVFLFSLIQDFAWLGVAGSAMLLASGIANYFAGKIYDKRPLRRAHPAFSLMIALSWVIMWFSQLGVVAASAQAIRKLISPFWWMKIKRFALMRGEQLDSMMYGVVWEWTTSLAYVLGLVVGGGLLLITTSWQWLLLPTMVGVVLSSVAIERVDGRRDD